MNKRHNFLIRILITVGLAIVLVLFIYLGFRMTSTVFDKLNAMFPSENTRISSELGVDISNGTVTIHTDDHGGFHGDGMLYMEIQFSDDALLEEIKASESWSCFPLSDTVTALVYGFSSDQFNYSPRIKDTEGNLLIPNITNGYFFFLDRQTHTDTSDPFDVLKRPSYNFTLAIYDADTGILYYVEYDT